MQLVLLLLLVAARATLAAASCTTMAASYIPGGDLTCKEVGSNEACCDWCRATTRCRAWTRERASRICCLKRTRRAMALAHDCCDSGLLEGGMLLAPVQCEAAVDPASPTDLQLAVDRPTQPRSSGAPINPSGTGRANDRACAATLGCRPCLPTECTQLCTSLVGAHSVARVVMGCHSDRDLVAFLRCVPQTAACEAAFDAAALALAPAIGTAVPRMPSARAMAVGSALGDAALMLTGEGTPRTVPPSASFLSKKAALYDVAVAALRRSASPTAAELEARAMCELALAEARLRIAVDAGERRVAAHVSALRGALASCAAALRLEPHLVRCQMPRVYRRLLNKHYLGPALLGANTT